MDAGATSPSLANLFGYMSPAFSTLQLQLPWKVKLQLQLSVEAIEKGQLLGEHSHYLLLKCDLVLLAVKDLTIIKLTVSLHYIVYLYYVFGHVKWQATCQVCKAPTDQSNCLFTNNPVFATQFLW